MQIPAQYKGPSLIVRNEYNSKLKSFDYAIDKFLIIFVCG